MAAFRIISRLDIKGSNLIKGIRLEGLRVMGNPHEFALKYYEEGIDEIIFMDVVASLYGRNNLGTLLEATTKDVFIPLTVGGGIRSVDDAFNILRSGADKIAINTSAIKNPKLIEDLATRFGSQCVVLSIEAKKNGDTWEAYTDGGREGTGLKVIDWVKTATDLGAGEILLTSVDHEGTRQGFDTELTKAVTNVVNVPVIASGGFGKLEDLKKIAEADASAVAIADAFHYRRFSISNVREEAKKSGLDVRVAS